MCKDLGAECADLGSFAKRGKIAMFRQIRFASALWPFKFHPDLQKEGEKYKGKCVLSVQKSMCLFYIVGYYIKMGNYILYIQ